MPNVQQFDASIDNSKVVYSNENCVGENHFNHPRTLLDNEFAVLTNVDISVPGKRRKRASPAIFAQFGVSNTSFQALCSYNVSGTEKIVAVQSDGTVYFIAANGSAAAVTGAGTPTATGYCILVPAASSVYLVDSAGALWRIDSGGTYTAIAMTDAGGVALGAIKDLVFYLNRLWFAVGDSVYFSDVIGTTGTATTNLQHISSLPLVCQTGNGATVRKLMTYRTGLLLIFKYGINGSPGSIHLADVSTNNPVLFTFNVLPQFDGINLISPRTVVRAGFDQNAEIIFGTVEGLRTEQFTALDRLVTPSLPLSNYEIDNVLNINTAAYDACFCTFFNDELLWFIATSANTTADTILSYNTRIPKERVFQGWTSLTWTAVVPKWTTATIAGLSGKPILYVGQSVTGNAPVVRSLSQTTYASGGDANTYTETSRAITFGIPDQDKELTEFTIQLGSDHTGNVTGTLTFDDGSTLSMGTVATTGSAGDNQTVTTTLNLLANANRPLCKTVQVTLTSTSLPSILGWQIRAIPRQFRNTGYNDTISAASAAATAVSQDTVTAAAVVWY